jgi:hypothetical protein
MREKSDFSQYILRAGGYAFPTGNTFSDVNRDIFCFEYSFPGKMRVIANHEDRPPL